VEGQDQRTVSTGRQKDAFARWTRAIKRGDSIAVRHLLESGMSVDVRQPNGWTPLMYAAGEGETPIVEMLLAHGADANAVNLFGCSPLAYATLQGHDKTVQALLAAGASIDVRPHGFSLMQFAASGRGRFQTGRHFETLRKAGAV
jgi:ankyrin repeat protein